MKIQRALISVSDKTNIIELAKALHAQHVELLSTGGTAQLLKQHQIPVIEVAKHTGFPEIMEGRVKTLHPKIHGGILARRGTDEAVMAQTGIAPIDMVVVNLYPFQSTVANPTCTFDEAIENIDIGGPAMLRAAAKNHAHVAVVVDPNDYPVIIDQLQQSGGLKSDLTRKLAYKAFAHTAQYDAAIAKYLSGHLSDTNTSDTALLPEQFQLTLTKKQALRYGENPHQQAALYIEPGFSGSSVTHATQLQGKELSFNNIADADAAFECVCSFGKQPACVIVKHANPCGVAAIDNQKAAYEKAYSTDPVSAFGGIIAFNQPLEAETAQAIITRQFVEVIIAPGVTEKAAEILLTKPNIRVLTVPAVNNTIDKVLDYKRVTGGFLIQERDDLLLMPDQLKVVTVRQPTRQEHEDLLFAWQVAKFVKSNAIVYAKQGMTIGIGAGQMSRVDSARIAKLKAQDAGLTLAGSVMASDAFFPFRDTIDTAADAGITAIIQPGGSIRDEEVIAAANEANIAMLFTGIRHFKH